MPLISVMHVFVSSRYVVMEDVALRRKWLPTPFAHEGLGGQAIQFRKPRRYIREYRLNEDSSPGAPYSYSVTFKPELTG